nr:MAG TPA: hypothetical protein [Caudoviricetes sp.]
MYHNFFVMSILLYYFHNYFIMFNYKKKTLCF